MGKLSPNIQYKFYYNESPLKSISSNTSAFSNEAHMLAPAVRSHCTQNEFRMLSGGSNLASMVAIAGNERGKNLAVCVIGCRYRVVKMCVLNERQASFHSMHETFCISLFLPQRKRNTLLTCSWEKPLFVLSGNIGTDTV